MKRIVLLVCMMLFVFSSSLCLAKVIETADLADGAVTTLKIADGAVTDAKIAGMISGAKLGAHSHDGSDIADGSIVEGKISGQISAAKISSVGLDSDTLDGVDSSGFATAAHGHLSSDVSGLDTALANKA
ncbi:MAG: hypothetical protein OET90_11420, partial [Desulfuromonadales bacterium]|nr:hypothetical protein [Desulfuromonadales bacterium]